MSGVSTAQGPKGGQSVSVYRAVVVDAQGAAVRVEDLSATRFDAAAALSQNMADASAVYLWVGRRFVGRFRSEENESDPLAADP
jgi:hypothetical protein